MQAIIRICKNTIALKPNEVLHESLDNTLIQKEIIELNQEQMYEKGVFADGTPTGNYAANTIEGTKQYLGKKQKGQRYDHITFKDTGELYNSMRFENRKDEFEVTGNDVKEGVDLSEEYGKPLFGLTDPSIAEVREMVKPIVIDKTLQAILKK